MGSSSKIPIWLDCDPGHDDAFAIALAALHPSLDLIGISTVHGNAPVHHTTHNALSILTAIGRPDIPVYKGSNEPFCRNAVHAEDIHGATGLDGTNLLPEPKHAAESTNAILAMQTALLSHPPQTVYVIATGALTNVALLFSVFPELSKRVAGLSIMGGAIGDNFTSANMGRHRETAAHLQQIGNITPWAEFNILIDPEAASSLFRNPFLTPKTTLIPLDLTHYVIATPSVLALLHFSSTNPQARPRSTLRTMFVELLGYFSHTYATVFGLTDGPPLHDPVAVAAVLPSMNDCFDDRGGERFEVNVVLEGRREDRESQVGRTTMKKLGKGEKGVRIPRSIDSERLWLELDACFSRAEALIDGNGGLESG